MDFTNMLFSPNGRIGQKEYWVGIMIIILGNILAGMIPILGTILWLGLIYVGVCVYGKRLHDIGKTAWIHALVWGVSIALTVLAFAFAGGSLLAAGLNNNEVDAAAVLAASGSLLLFTGLGSLIWLGYTIWLGVIEGEAGPNRYGQPPVRTISSEPVNSPPPGGDEPPAA